MPLPDYRGRFAPSPTGPLHFGSLIAAVASFLEARKRGGEWLVRIEDVDPPRVVPGAADDILRTLDAFGMHWDGDVMYQSRRGDAYAAALDALRDAGALYPCACSRREIADSALPGTDGPIYPGTCRNGIADGKAARAWRVRVGAVDIGFDDRVQGTLHSRLAKETGDFVVRRADGLYAYQLAVVVDDAAQRITDVVRGADLLGSTARQILLQQLLGVPTPGYAHVPVVVTARGEKLSKQTGAAAVDRHRTVALLCDALALLGQAPPAGSRTADLDSLWAWARSHWDLAKVPRMSAIPATVGVSADTK